MRAIPVASIALLGAAALSACVPAGAVGGDSTFGFVLHPGVVEPGGEVTLGVGRTATGCRGRVTVTSAVFDPVTIPRDESSATTRVDRDARPGVHRVTFACAERTGHLELTIADGGAHHPTPPPHHPKGVHAGAGGSVAGLDLGRLGLGALLVAGAVGTAYRLARRRGEDAA